MYAVFKYYDRISVLLLCFVFTTPSQVPSCTIASVICHFVLFPQNRFTDVRGLPSWFDSYS
jgi:hypothetical protein